MPSITGQAINRRLIAEKYIRSTMPVFWTDLSRHDGLVFPSDDAFGLSMAVTGTKQGPRGRIFTDGSTDQIQVTPITNLPTGAVATTIMIWYLTTTLTGIHRPFDLNAYGVEQANASLYGFSNSGQRATATIITGKWYCVHFAQSTGSLGNVLDLDGGAVIVSDSTSTTLGASVSPLVIGNWQTSTRAVSGMIGIVAQWNRVLTPLERTQNYLMTKWKYQ